MKTSRDFSPLASAEIGRYAHLYIQEALLIKNKSERQIAVENVVNYLLENSQTTTKLQEETRLKIWLQLLEITDYQLNVQLPENLPARKKKIPAKKSVYPTTLQTFRHYGAYLQKIIAQITTLTAENQLEMVKNLLIYMKQAQQYWSNEELSQEQLIADFQQISKGKIDIQNLLSLDNQPLLNLDKIEPSSKKIAFEELRKPIRSSNFLKKPKHFGKKR
jgi:Domain of unknown function (DUF4290)